MLKVFKQSIVLVLLFLLWEVAPRTGLVDAAFFPPISEVITALWNLIVSGELFTHFLASIIRSFSGFALALLIAIPLGLLIGWYPLARELLNPVLELFRNTAALALLPVFMLLLGIGETSKITIVLFACTWPILLNTIAAVGNVDPLLIKAAKSMNIKAFKLFLKVILPASVPTIFTGIRMAGTGAILVLIAAEMVGAKEGLGYLITYSQYNFQIPQMYAGILTIALLGLLINQGLTMLERKFSKWKQPVNE
ncbi:NitT/TauT family transport system permease protein [Paenibacillus sp. PastH-3]|uniref:ABC transporter permease n=1 Tax=Paenibacillus sp. PastF-4 TaxID=2940536 RepID=UPI00247DD5C2|nr:NitT/TauT family transport system permease protein [Paenibacillus sp. PastH-4]MDH6446591.1 NitT/TauT family transport system permease protein [Paenibacillus sp. PastF-4]MDH6530951.1 NitT/TauT family transport system permease protein [Paenibacillus sp. PastH-3]